MTTGLTPKQAKFVEHYALSGNATEAARLAGYSAATSRQIGSRLLSNVDVKQALEARREVFRAELGVTRQDVVSSILEAIQMGREQQNPAAMISGCVQLAKLLGFYEPERIAVDFALDTGNLKAKFAGMSDDDLLAIASSACRPVPAG